MTKKKDPAFLFYYQDFLVGTDHMDNEEVGAYIRCMCHQAHSGSISEKHMKKICLTQSVHEIVRSKFEKADADGCYVNPRLKSEIEKRRAYAESRANNRKGCKKNSNDTCETYEAHMEDENKDINNNSNSKTTNRTKTDIPPPIEEVRAYCKERRKGVDPETWYNFYQSKGWMIGKNRMKDWKAAVRTWERSSSPPYSNPIPDLEKQDVDLGFKGKKINL